MSGRRDEGGRTDVLPPARPLSLLSWSVCVSRVASSLRPCFVGVAWNAKARPVGCRNLPDALSQDAEVNPRRSLVRMCRKLAIASLLRIPRPAPAFRPYSGRVDAGPVRRFTGEPWPAGRLRPREPRPRSSLRLQSARLVFEPLLRRSTLARVSLSRLPPTLREGSSFRLERRPVTDGRLSSR